MLREVQAAAATVLVVDDNAANRQLVVTLLKYQGHRLFEANDGREALEMARTIRPQLVISDIVMPSMDGFEFVRQLRADRELAGTDVIFYTAHFHEREAQKLAEACQVARVIIKPCEPADILNAVEQVLRGTPAPGSPGVPEEFDREHLQLITNKLAEKAEELHSAYSRLRALTDLNLQLASERDPQVLLKNVCYGARKLLGARHAVLAVHEKRDANALFFTSSGIENPDDLSAPLLSKSDPGPLGQVYAQRSAWRTRLAGNEPVPRVFPADYPRGSAYLAVPVSSLSHTYGWLCLQDKIGAAEFDAEDERVLGILGAQVGRIYENGSLYQEVQMHAAQLQVEMDERERSAVGLRRSEERFRQLAENIQDVFFITSADFSELIYVSPAYQRIWGRTPDPQRPFDWINGVHPDDRDRVVGQLEENAVQLSNAELEYRIVRPDASIRSILTRYYPLRDEHGHPYRIVGVSTDITERKLAEARIQHLNRVYAVLSGINALIVRARTKGELFAEACRLAVDQGDFQLAWIGCPAAGSERIAPVAWAGDDFMVTQLLRDDAENPNEGVTLLSAAARLNRPQVCNDLDTGNEKIPYRKEMMARGYRSIVVLPLTIQDRAMGCLVLGTEECGAFDAAEMRLLVELAGDISFALDHIEKAEKLDYLAYYDSLTGLANRTLFLERVSQRISLAGEGEGQFAVVVADPERFDTINDTFGRSQGDALLKEMADRLSRGSAGANAAARLGSDQFATVIPYTGDASIAARLFDEQRHAWVGSPFRIDGSEINLSLRAGIALYPQDGGDAETLLRNANAARMRAKSTGDRVVFFTQQISERIAERLSMETRLRRALENEEFVLHYQPKVDLETRKLEGVEALIRWQSPELGLVPPDKFITLMEETGMIVDVGAWVLRRASLDHAVWLERGLRAPRIAVNVSTVQLRRADFVNVVRDAIAPGMMETLDFDGRRTGIDIEVTESLLVEGAEANIEKLRAIRDLGIGIAIDDFGTGYSSLSYLTRLPVESLKIDRSFTMAMLDDPGVMTLVSTMITLAHSLKLNVIAEGVESEEQAKILRLLRCDQMQGYLISKPLPFEAVTQLFDRRKG